MIELQKYDESFYEEIKGWWDDRGSSFVPHALLPATGTVACLKDDDGALTPVAAAWCYLDNSVGFSMIAWPCVSIKSSAFNKLEALNMCIEFITKHVLDDLGYTFMTAMPNVTSISRVLDAHQFQRISSGGILMGRIKDGN